MTSNIKARRNVMSLPCGPADAQRYSQYLERFFKSLNKWELDQRLVTGLPQPDNSEGFLELQQLEWPQNIDRPDWHQVILGAINFNQRDGHWLKWIEPDPLRIVVPPPPPPPKEDPQERIIKANAGACQLVDAAPGTGKTYCLLRRLRHLVDQGLTRNLQAEALVLTFSRTAKAEAKARAAAEFMGNDGTQKPEFRTIDSLAVELLEVACGESVADHDTRKTRLLAVLNGGGQPYESVIARLARYKWIFIDEFQDIIGLNGRTLLRIIELSIEGRKRHGTTEEGRKPPGLLVLGDHRQYINFFQLKSINDSDDRDLVPEVFIRKLKLLLSNHQARLETIRLEKIYRAGSTGRLPELMVQVRDILDRALQCNSDLANLWALLVGKIRSEAQFSVDRSGLLNLIRNGQPHEGAVSGRFGLLSRSNSRARRLASICMADSGLRSRVNLVQSPEGMGFPGWLGLMLLDDDGAPVGNLADDAVFAQAYSRIPGQMKPRPDEAKDYINEAAGALGLVWQGQMEAHDFLEALQGGDEPSELRLVSDPQGIWISTVHQSKGRQFPDVFLDESELLPDALQGDSRDAQLESVRITYVAATRAMSEIHRIGKGVFRGLVDWNMDGPGGIDDIEHWENWYHSHQGNWGEARESLWESYMNGWPLMISHSMGRWQLHIGFTPIDFNEYYDKEFAQRAGALGNNARFECQILDVRCRAVGGNVFLMPILSGDLRRIDNNI